MCRILGVSRAHYYRYRSPKPSKRRAEDEDLKQRILRIFAEFKQRYGVMKIHHELNLELQPLQRRCSPRRISRLMKELDIHPLPSINGKRLRLPKPRLNSVPTCLSRISTIGREFIVHWATRPPYKLKSQHLRAKWPPDLMLSMVQISY